MLIYIDLYESWYRSIAFCVLSLRLFFNGLTQSPYGNFVRFDSSEFGRSCSTIDVISQRISSEIFEFKLFHFSAEFKNVSICCHGSVYLGLQCISFAMLCLAQLSPHTSDQRKGMALMTASLLPYGDIKPNPGPALLWKH